MAFVAVVPAVGSAVLPAIGAIGSGLGGALATGAGALGSGIAGLGSALGSVPLIGGIASPALTGLGGAIGGLGGGLGGALGLLGAGNIGGALGSLGGGLGAAGTNLFSGLGGMYGGLDKALGGFLPGGMTPAQGYFGQAFPAMQNMPIFGGTPNPFDTHGVMNFNPNDPFHVAQAQGLTAPKEGGLMGAIGGIANKAGKVSALMNAIDSTREPETTPQAVEHSINLQRGPTPNGGLRPGGDRKTGIFSGQYGPSGGNMGYQLQKRYGARAEPMEQAFTPRVGAESSLGRAYQNL